MTEPTSNDPTIRASPADAAAGSRSPSRSARPTGVTRPRRPTTQARQGSRGQMARDALSQLQKMIDDIATQAAPVARQIGAKAAELAAVAAEKAGPARTRPRR